MKVKYLLCLAILLICSGLISSYDAPSYNSVNLSLTDSYTAPSYMSVNLTLDGAVTPTECSPTINQDWLITDEQICDGVSRDIGTGSIKIGVSGKLILINEANVSASGLELLVSGDKVFINHGSELRI